MRVYYISVYSYVTKEFMGGIFTEAMTINDAGDRIQHILPMYSRIDVTIVESRLQTRDFDEEMLEFIANVPYNVLMANDQIESLDIDPHKFMRM